MHRTKTSPERPLSFAVSPRRLGRLALQALFFGALFAGIQQVFNAQVPFWFPALADPSPFLLSLGAALIFALITACGLPALGILGFIGLLAGRALDAYFFITDGNAYPSLLCNVLTVAAQGGGLLLGSLIEYARWLHRTLKRLLA